MKISFCTTCMGRLHHLRETLVQNLRDNPSGVDGGPDVEFVVVNYSSPDEMDGWIKTNPETRAAIDDGRLIYARYDDADHFEHAHAKNMAHRLATGDVLCNVDADNFTGPHFADLVAARMGPNPEGSFMHAHFGIMNGLPLEERGAFGRIALSRRNFMHMGGYDETLGGWGGEDGNLIVRALAMGLTPLAIDDQKHLRTIAHDHEERLRYALAEHKEDALKRIQTAGTTINFKSLRTKFMQVTGFIQRNEGHFGEGKVYEGVYERPRRLAEVENTMRSVRPAFLGAVPYYKLRLTPAPDATVNSKKIN